MSRPWSGGAQTGSREYTPEEAERVLNAIPRGKSKAVTMRTFSAMVRMDPRTVRAVLSDRDGVNFVMCLEKELMWDAECVEDAHGHTERLRARAESLLARVGRRERYIATHLERRQGVLALPEES